VIKKLLLLIFALIATLLLLSGVAMLITGYSEPRAAENCGTQRAMLRGDGSIFVTLGVIGLLVSRALSRWVDFDSKDNLRHG